MLVKTLYFKVLYVIYIPRRFQPLPQPYLVELYNKQHQSLLLYNPRRLKHFPSIPFENLIIKLKGFIL